MVRRWSNLSPSAAVPGLNWTHSGGRKRLSCWLPSSVWSWPTVSRWVNHPRVRWLTVTVVVTRLMSCVACRDPHWNSGGPNRKPRRGVRLPSVSCTSAGSPNSVENQTPPAPASKDSSSLLFRNPTVPCRSQRPPGVMFSVVVVDRKSTTSELQSQSNLVCRLLLEKKKLDAYLHPLIGIREL